MNVPKTVSYTDRAAPAAALDPGARWLWLDPARHPGAEVTQTTVFAPAPEGFRFLCAEFEKTVIRKNAAPAVLHAVVFADPRFRLWVNGVYVGTGPVAAGGDYANTKPMPKQYPSAFDVPVEGEKLVIRAEIWNGCAVMTDYSVGRCGFRFSGEVGGQIVLSDKSWRVRLMPGQKGVRETDLTAGAGEWETPAELDAESCPWSLAESGLPPLAETLVTPSALRRETEGDTAVLRAEFERIYSAYLCLSITNRSENAARLRVGIGEYMPAAADTETIVVPPAAQTEYRSLRMYSAGSVVVKAPPGVETAISLSYARYPVDAENEGYFRCSDEMLNRICEVGKFTLEMCRQSLHLDSPLHQEMLGCTGDYAIEALMTRAAFGDMRLTRLDLLRTADYLVMTDGVMFHTSYSLIWVTMLRDYVRWTGDEEVLRSCLPALEVLLRRFESYIGDAGVIENPPNYMFVDWANVDGFQLHHPPMALGQTVLNAFYQGALVAAAELYEMLSKKDDAARLRKQAEKHRVACVLAFYDFEKNLFTDGWPRSRKNPQPNEWQPENPDKVYYSRHANALAVLFGLISGGGAKELAERVLTEDSLDEGTRIEVQPYFMHYLFEMAVKTGLFEKHAVRLAHLWDKQVTESPKGLKEGWGEFRGDCSHAWGGTPVYELPMRIAGFEMLSDGWDAFRLRPRLFGGLEWAEIGIPTPWGLLRMKIDSCGAAIDLPDEFERDGHAKETVFVRKGAEQKLTKTEKLIRTLMVREKTETVKKEEEQE